MNQELIRKQQDLTARLNRYRHEYYNLNAPSISDAVYDRLFEELQDLERQTGFSIDGYDLKIQYLCPKCRGEHPVRPGAAEPQKP